MTKVHVIDSAKALRLANDNVLRYGSFHIWSLIDRVSFPVPAAFFGGGICVHWSLASSAIPDPGLSGDWLVVAHTSSTRLIAVVGTECKALIAVGRLLACGINWTQSLHDILKQCNGCRPPVVEEIRRLAK